jgi:hypothetical protein
MFNSQRRRHPEAPRSLQRGEGSRAGRHRAVASSQMLHARSLARLKNAVLRDDACDCCASVEDAYDARSQ